MAKLIHSWRGAARALRRCAPGEHFSSCIQITNVPCYWVLQIQRKVTQFIEQEIAALLNFFSFCDLCCCQETNVF